MVSEELLNAARDVTKDWMSQTTLNACMVCCLYNITYEISTRRIAPLERTFKYSEISRYLNYDRDTGASWDNLHPAMGRIIRASKSSLWARHVEEEDRRLPIIKTCETADNQYSSFPLISLDAEFLRDQYDVKIPDHPMKRLGHTVVVVGCTKDETILFDPYANYCEADSIRILPKEKVEYYWSITNVPRGIAWFERGSKVLEEYQEVA